MSTKKTLHGLPTIFQKMKEDMSMNKEINLLNLMWESETLDIYTQLFTKAERLKIVNQAVSSVVDLDALDEFYDDMFKKKQKGFANLFNLATSAIGRKLSFFPLHDRRITIGKNYNKMFHNLKTLKKPLDTLLVPKLKIMVQLEKPVDDKNKSLKVLGGKAAKSNFSQHSRGHSVMVERSPESALNHELLVPDNEAGSFSRFSNHIPNSPRNDSKFSHMSLLSMVGERRTKSIGYVDVTLEAALFTRDLMVKAVKLLSKQPQVVEKEEVIKANEYLYQVIQTSQVYADIGVDEGDVEGNKQDGANDQGTQSPRALKRTDKKDAKSKLKSRFNSMFGVKKNTAVDRLQKRNKFISSLTQNTQNLLESDARSRLKIREFYFMEEERLVDSMLQSFFTTVEMRTLLIPEFKNIPIDIFRCVRDQNVALPLKDHFVRSFAIGRKQFKEDEVVGYFGEKTAFYFTFLSFIQSKSWRIAIEATVLSAIDLIFLGYGNPEISIAQAQSGTDSTVVLVKIIHLSSKVYFCLRIIFWLSRLIGMWNRHEQGFTNKYGQSQEDEAINEGPVRPLFKGKPQRNLRNDQMSDSMPIGNKRFFGKGLVAAILYVALMAGNFISAFYVLSFKRELTQNDVIAVASGGFNYSDHVVFGVFEVGRIILFRYIAAAIIKRILVWRNYKHRKEHEGALISILGTFSLLNNMAAPLIISYQSLTTAEYVTVGGVSVLKYKDAKCLAPGCSDELTLYLLVYVVIQLAYIIFWKSFVKKLFTYILTKSKDVIEDVLNKDKFDATAIFKKDRQIFKQKWELDSTDAFSKLEHDPDVQKMLIQNKTAGSEAAKMLNNIVEEKINFQLLRFPRRYFELINKEIDWQVVELEDGDPGWDYDPNTDEYLNIFGFVAFACLFGLAFPLIFVTTFMVAVVERYFDARKILIEEKRAVPENCESMEVWVEFLRFIQSVACVFGPFYLSFVIMSIEGLAYQLLTFVVLSLSSVVVINYTDSLYGGGNTLAATIKSRFKFLTDQQFSGTDLF